MVLESAPGGRTKSVSNGIRMARNCVVRSLTENNAILESSCHAIVLVSRHALHGSSDGKSYIEVPRLQLVSWHYQNQVCTVTHLTSPFFKRSISTWTPSIISGQRLSRHQGRSQCTFVQETAVAKLHDSISKPSARISQCIRRMNAKPVVAVVDACCRGEGLQ